MQFFRFASSLNAHDVCCFIFLDRSACFNTFETAAFQLRNYAVTVILYAMPSIRHPQHSAFESHDLLINTNLHQVFCQFDVAAAAVVSSWSMFPLAESKEN